LAVWPVAAHGDRPARETIELAAGTVLSAATAEKLGLKAEKG
jgi:hypothetical protein